MLSLLRRPFFSVVTVTYNAENTIKHTLDSILSQKNGLFELIVVDGGSKDNTIKICNQVKNKIDVFISEPDQGIYDAMNKAINHASGIYVVFINSGDAFFSNDTLSKIYDELDRIKYLPDLVYGKHAVKYANDLIKIIEPKKSISSKIKTMPICHQSLYAKKELLERYPFDINLKIVADYKFILQAKNNNESDFYIDDVLSIVSPGGVSDARRDLAIREYARVYGSLYYIGIIERLFYLGLRIKELIKLCVKVIIRYKK